MRYVHHIFPWGERTMFCSGVATISLQRQTNDKDDLHTLSVANNAKPKWIPNWRKVVVDQPSVQLFGKPKSRSGFWRDHKTWKDASFSSTVVLYGISQLETTSHFLLNFHPIQRFTKWIFFFLSLFFPFWPLTSSRWLKASTVIIIYLRQFQSTWHSCCFTDDVRQAMKLTFWLGDVIATGRDTVTSLLLH